MVGLNSFSSVAVFAERLLMRVNTNIASLQAQTSMTKVTRETDETLAKLSSGQRIVKAADDAAGLAISERLKAHIRSGKQADRNANDGISLVQTAEGGLNETTAILTRMRELAIQAATDSLGDGDRANSSYEYEHLKQELERISQVTEFNGHKLLNGSGPTMDFHVGVGTAGSEDVISFQAGKHNAGISALGVQSTSIMAKPSAQSALGQIDGAFNTISGHRASLGSIQNRLLSSSQNLGVYNVNMSVANSRIRDADIAEESSKLARNQIMGQSGTAVMAQANSAPQVALKLMN